MDVSCSLCTPSTLSCDDPYCQCLNFCCNDVHCHDPSCSYCHCLACHSDIQNCKKCTRKTPRRRFKVTRYAAVSDSSDTDSDFEVRRMSIAFSRLLGAEKPKEKAKRPRVVRPPLREKLKAKVDPKSESSSSSDDTNYLALYRAARSEAARQRQPVTPPAPASARHVRQTLRRIATCANCKTAPQTVVTSKPHRPPPPSPSSSSSSSDMGEIVRKYYRQRRAKLCETCSCQSPEKTRNQTCKSPQKYRKHSCQSPEKIRRHNCQSPEKHRDHVCGCQPISKKSSSAATSCHVEQANGQCRGCNPSECHVCTKWRGTKRAKRRVQETFCETIIDTTPPISGYVGFSEKSGHRVGERKSSTERGVLTQNAGIGPNFGNLSPIRGDKMQKVHIVHPNASGRQKVAKAGATTHVYVATETSTRTRAHTAASAAEPRCRDTRRVVTFGEIGRFAGVRDLDGVG
eukprot:Rmarinus@m.14896